MSDLTALIEILKNLLENPWMLLFLGVWIIGYMLKEHTPLKNTYIPWIILGVAGALSFVLLEQSLNGVIIGFIIGYIQIGMYEHYKNLIETFLTKP